MTLNPEKATVKVQALLFATSGSKSLETPQGPRAMFLTPETSLCPAHPHMTQGQGPPPVWTKPNAMGESDGGILTAPGARTPCADRNVPVWEASSPLCQGLCRSLRQQAPVLRPGRVEHISSAAGTPGGYQVRWGTEAGKRREPEASPREALNIKVTNHHFLAP